MRRNCPDCNAKTRVIRLIDHGHRNHRQPLSYVAKTADRSVFTGRYPLSGEIQARMCPECGRVVLYAKPKRSKP